MTRREAREQAFILVFERMFSPELSFDEMKEIAHESELFEIDPFAERICMSVFANEQQADDIIASFAKGWKVSRLPKVSLAVLRLAVCEILYEEDIPDSVSVNEAVELAKKYATAEDASFINGLLGSVIRSKKADENQ